MAGCLWGTGFYFGRLALNEMRVEYMVLYRFLFACVGMLPLVVANRRRFHLTASEMRTLLIAAALGVPIQFLIQFHGLALTTVSHASADGGRHAGAAGRRRCPVCWRAS